MVESFSLNANAIKQIEELIKESGLYGSKSEFYREAVREKTLELIKLKQTKIRKEFTEIARKRGYKPKFPGFLTREEKIEIADKYLEERGLKKLFGR